jgi:amino acid permease
MATSSSSSSSESFKQTLSAATFNLVKACVGSGVLALSAGVAAIGDVPLVLLPASTIILLLGTLSAYSFHMIGRISLLLGEEPTTTIVTEVPSLSSAWKQEMGPSTAWIVSLACFLTPLGAALTYSIILGDMISSLASSLGNTFLAHRHWSVLGVSSLALWPLCHLQSLQALSPISMVGVVGMIFTTLFMMWRVPLIFPSSPYNPVGPLSAGPLLTSLPLMLQPSFGHVGLTKVFSPTLLLIVSMAATSYLVHFSAHDFYNGLKQASMKRFTKLTLLGFATTILINIAIMSFGFLTFGGNAQGMILNNYSPYDIGAMIARCIVTISLIGSYPLIFRGMKSAFFELFPKLESKDGLVTKGFLMILTGLALVLNDAGFMVSMVGALMGSAIIYIFPSTIFLRATKRRIQKGSMNLNARLVVERWVNKGLIAMGALFGLLGATITILDTFFPGYI